MRSAGPWLSLAVPRPTADVRLFCFAYAGGGASMFASWARFLPARIEVRAIQLPGRENRFREAPISDLATVLDHVHAAIAPHLDRPYVLFGHSLGALLAYETVRRLAGAGMPLPARLVVSGKRAPHHPPRGPLISRLADEQFIDEISRYDGTPDSLLGNSEFMQCILPRLRADATLFDDYEFVGPGRVPCPITAFGGTDDPYVNTDELLGWSDLAPEFDSRRFDGGHFFINSQRNDVLGALAGLLRQVGIDRREPETAALVLQ